MSRTILITGASIAGNTAAWWLGRAGFDVTVVERSPEFRTGGQNIDVRGVGREVLRRMGLEQVALEQGTGEEGTAWIEDDGTIAAQFLAGDTGTDGPTAEMEILRGDLARLLYEPAREHAAYRFGDAIARIDQDEEGATVTFASGITERYDAVIIAEGVGSGTRELVFPGENDPRWMDLTIAYFTIPRRPEDDRLWRWYNALGGRSVSLRPDRHGTARAMLSVQQPPDGEQDWGADRQKAWLRDRFADAGWQSARVLEGLEATDDFYFDVLRQVRMPRWSRGRVVLTGDAAWCATPIAGYGTTLAITGAYVLAQELIRSTDVRAALAAYEQAMRPMVEDAQGVPKIAPRLANPHSRIGIRLLHAALSVASRPAVRGVAGKLFGGRSKDVDLSRYDMVPSDGLAVASSAPAPTGLSPLLALGALSVVLGTSAIVGRRNAPDPSHPGIRRWYHRLHKPGYTPPDAAFGAVWPVLETGLAVGGYRLLRQPSGRTRNAAVGLWLVNSAMVGGWTQLFFREKRLGASAAASGAMVVTGAAYVATAAKVDRPAAVMAIPFVAWLGFATLLAGRIWRDNRGEGR
ncbi:2-polyprenyl-6-methoxyphenol hydroxylase-like FAD-dependent oxidoreductase/tryptophan-rich sensory protein [Sphingomonas sp. SORGH_AS802]|uniref:tryptophan-rich sensory protein n=1 Tax=unclassified Sphingomonas TaxID=196159 RepID=UPI0028651C84|nr:MULTISPECIES: tryptophan-rich sensory protein [unclassified Sphingomonas]MDR6126856.1 2-polyprenyl-6-methoxyphenol hydroxylase-like FAD-dependent oxidoreductase/tryptophan-rich sensory protein [Sphingomonas sp. SORGH_AS_0438]MDR6134782.1 2-polyprenyl-6-methoxyphenol hydroxylase-like FAD-dependent oxidoreductase/tryptophan-rich sensory protein [Sphingomonas sp. SORGH_AS_0802]